MSVLVVGISHRTAPVPVLERTVLDNAAVSAVLDAALGLGAPPGVGSVTAMDTVAAVLTPVEELLVVSTCNRVELYAEVSKFHAGVTALTELLARASGQPLDVLTPHLYVHYEDRAVQHLFEVACGLDSMVVGEPQILGQVRLALRAAQDHGTAGRVLDNLVQQALRVGKRAHSETGIDHAGQSLVTVGISGLLGGLEQIAGRPVMVVGAGSLGSLAISVLQHAGAGPMTVANRSLDAAIRVARQVDGTGIGLDEVHRRLTEVDLVITCTGAPGHIITTADLAAAAALRADRGQPTLAVLDLAMPRDVEPSARHLDGVRVMDLEQLQAHHLGTEAATDVEQVRALVSDETAAYLTARRMALVAPTVTALRNQAAAVVADELARLDVRLPELDAAAREEVQRTVRRVVDKLLHAPTVAMKQAAAAQVDADSYARTVQQLFGLDTGAVEALVRAGRAAQ